MNSALSLCWPLFCLFVCLFVGLCSEIMIPDELCTEPLLVFPVESPLCLNLFWNINFSNWYIDSFVDLCRTLQWAFIGLSGGVSTLLSTLVDKIEKWACSMVHKYDFSKSYESLFCRGNQYSGCRKFDADVVQTLKDAPQSEFNVTWLFLLYKTEYSSNNFRAIWLCSHDISYLIPARTWQDVSILHSSTK